MLVEGHRAKEIAARLAVSPKTIDTYRASMMRKLDIHDVAGLVKFAITRKLTSLPGGEYNGNSSAAVTPHVLAKAARLRRRRKRPRHQEESAIRHVRLIGKRTAGGRSLRLLRKNPPGAEQGLDTRTPGAAAGLQARRPGPGAPDNRSRSVWRGPCRSSWASMAA
jgi:hypothetical protein